MLYNYADDNTLAYFSRTMSDLVDTQKKETGVALPWLKQNEMITNHEKFHAILLKLSLIFSFFLCRGFVIGPTAFPRHHLLKKRKISNKY